MRRIISVLAVVALMAAMLTATAAPAFAQLPPLPPPPNCEFGQAHAIQHAFEHEDLGQVFHHAEKFLDCLVSEPPGEGQ